MASFPVFLNFDVVPPLVVGNTALAVIKTRLLLKRATRVNVATDAVTPDR